MPPSTNDIEPLPNAFGITESRYMDENSVTLAKPLVELEMISLSAALRSKTSWWIKFRDQNILGKWRAEALEKAEHMKESHVDYVLKELDGYAKLRNEDTGAEVACYDHIWQSDKLIPAPLKDKLVAGVAKLEDVPDSEKDWHPRSNNLVLDLVHPSLYPIVYGRTLAYPEGSTDRDATKLKPIPPPYLPKDMYWKREKHYQISPKFQWLPTDFVVSGDGKSVKSISYINNLHPDQHGDLYTTIEGLIGAFIPLFERVLTDSIPTNHAVPARTENLYSYDEEYKPEPDWSYPVPDGYEELYQEWAKNRPIRLPDVSSEGYVLGSLEKRDTWYSLAGRTIQVIVKLANIHLVSVAVSSRGVDTEEARQTPEKPEYSGGSWHIEGMLGEAIAASGIYYYAEDNITESRLAFRTAACIPQGYEQCDERGCRLTWGISRTIAFPNLYQHKVSPFELKDKTKPGHRKIVALFLVDPALHRPSTTIGAFDKLAPEIMNHINSLADDTMTWEEANAYRLELMDERKVFVAENDQNFFQVAFSLCEH
ncbi:hypothetical protein FRC10_004556 [Ceratobasidium sp. 414]|nr:hypothetical protein FRC10_004556 [Ceratobasidium sp. 414]